MSALSVTCFKHFYNNVSIYTFTEKRTKKKHSSNFVGIKKIFLAGEIYYVGKILSHDSMDT